MFILRVHKEQTHCVSHVGLVVKRGDDESAGSDNGCRVIMI
jgi:hypothetical protein